MSYWSHHPELYDEIIFAEMVNQGLATGEEDVYETVAEFVKQPDSYKLIIEAERNYWSGRVDQAMAQMEDR